LSLFPAVTRLRLNEVIARRARLKSIFVSKIF